MTLVIPTTKLLTTLQSVVQINTGYPTTKLHTMLQSCHQPTKSYRVCDTDSDTQRYQFWHHYVTNKITATYACISLFSSFWRRRRKKKMLHYLTYQQLWQDEPMAGKKQSIATQKHNAVNKEPHYVEKQILLLLLLLLLLTNTFYTMTRSYEHSYTDNTY